MNIQQHHNTQQQQLHDTKSQKSKKKGIKKLFGFGGRRRNKKRSSDQSVDIDGESYFDTAATAPVSTPTPSKHAQQQQAWMVKQTSGSRGHMVTSNRPGQTTARGGYTTTPMTLQQRQRQRNS